MVINKVIISTYIIDPNDPRRTLFYEKISKSAKNINKEIKFFSLGRNSYYNEHLDIVRGKPKLANVLRCAILTILNFKEIYSSIYCRKMLSDTSLFTSIYLITIHIFKFYDACILYKPNLVILYSQFKPEHLCSVIVANYLGIKIKYMHTGVLEGSISLEEKGMMGESDLYQKKYIEEISEVTYTDAEIRKTKAFFDKVIVNKSSRKKAVINNDIIDFIKRAKSDGKYVILFAGSNDYESGFQPAWNVRRKNHCPNFKSTNQILEIMHHLSGVDNIQVIFKRHPHIDQKEYNIPSTVKHSEGGCMYDIINHCDAVFTVLSQVSYQALMLGKPVVLFGKNTVELSGAVYCCESKEQLLSKVEILMRDGYTKEMCEKFLKYCTYLRKRYLYLYDPIYSNYYDRDITEFTLSIFSI